MVQIGNMHTWLFIAMIYNNLDSSDESDNWNTHNMCCWETLNSYWKMLNGLFHSIDHSVHFTTLVTFTHSHTHLLKDTLTCSWRCRELEPAGLPVTRRASLPPELQLAHIDLWFLGEDVCWVSSPDCQLLTLWAEMPNPEDETHIKLHFVDLKVNSGKSTLYL